MNELSNEDLLKFYDMLKKFISELEGRKKEEEVKND